MSAIIRVALSRKRLQIAPGQRGELSVMVQNLSEIVDQYIFEVQGLDEAWLTLVPPRISLFPQDEGQLTIKLHPPDDAPAGSHEFAVRVESRENPVEFTVIQGVLEITPVFLFDVALAPQQKSTVGEGATFSIRLENQGNVDVTLRLSATDPEEACTYELGATRTTVDAGASAAVPLTVAPKGPAQERALDHTFTIRAAPVDAPERARTATGRIVCEPQVVSLDLSLWPPKRSAVGAGRFQVQLDNRGNTDLDLKLEGTDPAEACAYKFEPAQLALPAGLSRQVGLTVAPIGRPPTDQPRLYEFVVRAVPRNAPHKVVQTAGQLECLPVVISFDIAVEPEARTIRKRGDYLVRLANRCQTGLSLELSASSDQGACGFEFETRRVSLEAEEIKSIPLMVEPVREPPRGASRICTFSVQATPADAPHLSKMGTARVEIVSPRGFGALIWSVLGFALGNGILMPLLWADILPDFEGVLLLLFGIMGAVGGLFLGIGHGKRILPTALVGAIGFAPGGFLVMSGVFEELGPQAVWGGFAGLLLGLALKYRWRAIVLGAAGALALPLRLVLGQALWETPISNLAHEPAAVMIDVVIGSTVGLAFGLVVQFLGRWMEGAGARDPQG